MNVKGKHLTFVLLKLPLYWYFMMKYIYLQLDRKSESVIKHMIVFLPLFYICESKMIIVTIIIITIIRRDALSEAKIVITEDETKAINTAHPPVTQIDWQTWPATHGMWHFWQKTRRKTFWTRFRVTIGGM